LPYINDRRDKYGIDTSLSLQDGPEFGRKKVLVEFSSPNIASDFTAAHLRSTILGAFAANIYEAMGWDVVRINHLGDWGKHLGLLSVGWQKYGSEKIFDEQTDKFRYVHELYTRMEEEIEPEQQERKRARDNEQDLIVLESRGLFAERDTNFRSMEDGDHGAIAFWKKVRDISIEYYVNTYARLNIKFDEFSGESDVSLTPDAVAEVESIFKGRGIYEEQDGAWIIDFDKHGVKLGTAILRGRNGSTTYLLRDIATVFDRSKRYVFDKMFYVVGGQDVHFRQVFKAVELMGYGDIAEKLQHITFSKPSGTSFNRFKTLGHILDQRENSMRETMNAEPDQYHFDNLDMAAKTLGKNSLVIQELYSKKYHNNSLEANLMTLAEGENLQICYGRLCSSIESIGVNPTLDDVSSLDYSSLWEEPWCDLLRLMVQYPVIIKSAFTFKTLEPGTILSYLFRLAEELTFCLDEAEEESGGESSAAGSKYAARAVLYQSLRQVLGNGMKLLGVTPTGT
jgi:arginyl-tRNA synthetase